VHNRSILRVGLLLLLFGHATVGYSQKEASTWYFGWNAGLKFGSTGVRALTDGKAYYYIGFGSSISDENGNLLFYTNGDTTFNRHHHVMPNGSGLTGRSPAPTVVVPNPSNNGIYYIFVADRGTITSQGDFSYSTVDLALNSGLGDVTEKHHVLFNPVGGVLAAILHANGRDIWVVTHEWNTNLFFSYLVTAAGVSETPVVSTIGSVNWVMEDKQMHFSPDGDKIAVTSSPLGSPHYSNILEVFDFSVVSGKVSNLIFSVSDRTDPYKFRELAGVEFSPNGRFLYASNQDSQQWNKIFQFDLSLGNQSSILNSAIEVGSPQYGDEVCMQLGPDGKVYIAHGGGLVRFNLSRINYPNNKGLACGYIEGDVDLAGKYGTCVYLPIFVRNYVTPPPSFTTSPLCVLNSTTFYPSSLGYYDSLVWDFGDPASGAFNRSTIKQANHTFSSDGSYRISLTMYFDGLPRRKVTQQLVLNKMPRVELGSDTVICDGNRIVLNVANGFSQLWSNGEIGSSINVTKTGLYKVSLTNGQCTVRDSINVTVLDQPQVNFPDSLIICASSEVLDSKNPKFNVIWSTGDTTSTIQVNQTGIYSVRVSNGKCVALDTVFVRMARILDLTASANKDSVGYNENVVFGAQGSGIVQWHWNFGDGALSTEQSTPHVYQTEGNYQATIAATNSFGCTDSTSVKVFVSRVLFIPNVFTPNGDGKNDSFVIEYNGDQDFSLIIYDRWGHEIYNSYGRRNQWNGGSTEAGTFYYIVTIGIERFKGWVQLIR
jgi:gliding motility-associated-like protein